MVQAKRGLSIYQAELLAGMLGSQYASLVQSGSPLAETLRGRLVALWQTIEVAKTTTIIVWEEVVTVEMETAK